MAIMAIIGYGKLHHTTQATPCCLFALHPGLAAPATQDGRWCARTRYEAGKMGKLTRYMEICDLTAEACAFQAEYASWVRGACWTDGCSVSLTKTTTMR
jgi:hypothetical protein